MLGGIPLALLELWEVLDDPLHVLDGVELCLTLLGLQELLHHIVDRIGHISEVREHYLLEEAILVAREDDLLHFL